MAQKIAAKKGRKIVPVSGHRHGHPQIKTAPPLRCGPVVLAILDGWGVGPKGRGNAIDLAKTPFFDAIKKRYKWTTLQAHGRYVGLLPDQEGNSEAGHMNIGAGRVVRQDIVTVTEAIQSGTFYKNTAFKETFKHAKKYGTAVHLMGLLSTGNSAHAAPEHLHALLQLAHEMEMPKVYLHLFTDGRDSSPRSGMRLLREMERYLHPGQQIATVMGRFYAMDRNKIWRRTEMAYDAIAQGKGVVARSAHEAIHGAYERGETDEFILPTVIVDKKMRPLGTVHDDDVFVFFNLRSDRARQLTKCFVQKDFEKRNDGAFTRRYIPKNTRFAAMTEFGPDLEHIYTAFPSPTIRHGLTETLSAHRQFYIAESEKYAHVTYFFNGGFDTAAFGEDRMRVPSQFVAHHDDRPDMRATTITDEVTRRVRSRLHDLTVINYANADMVGHTANLQAAVVAVEHVDSCLARLAEATKEVDGVLVIVGDHGNAESMIDPRTGEGLTEHTSNSVPFHIVSEKHRRVKLGDGMLADVAPTILDIMGVPKPPEMTGFSLLRN